MVEPLNGAFFRHRRAQEHLADIEALIAEWRAQREFTLPYDQADEREEVIELPQGASPETDLSVRVGEMVYNLRASLDYAVFELSGRLLKPLTQFPLESDKDKFPRVGEGWLTGVSHRHWEIIEAVQPYNGNDWAELLRRLSNQDKHRELVLVDAVTQGPVRREVSAPLYPSPKLYPSPNLYPSAGNVKVHVELPIDVAFRDGPLLAQSLEELQTEVGAVLSSLKVA